MEKILITGGSGFIGRNLKEQLPDRYNVFAPSHAELDLLDENKIRDYLKEHRFDIVIHSATWDATRNSKKDTSKVLEYNLRMFFNLASSNDLYEKMIYFGSGAEFSREHWEPKMREDYFDIHVPTDQYGLSKYIMNKHAEKSENIYNLRLFGVFGKYEDWQIRFISNACCKAIWDLLITIKQNVFFDYLYIDDLVKITEWFIDHEPKAQSYNICTGCVFDLRTLADKVMVASGKDLEVVVEQNGLGKEYSGDNTRLLSEMGCDRFRNIDNCIEELYKWYLVNKETIYRNKLLVDK